MQIDLAASPSRSENPIGSPARDDDCQN